MGLSPWETYDALARRAWLSAKTGYSIRHPTSPRLPLICSAIFSPSSFWTIVINLLLLLSLSTERRKMGLNMRH